MIDLKARIAALEPLPKKYTYVGIYGQREPMDWQVQLDAALARLALLRDLIRERLVDGCAECGGFNVVFKPGADKHGAHYPPQTLLCPTCADWRALLEATKP